MPPNIYNLVFELVNGGEFKVNNSEIIKQRMIEIKPYINYNSSIDL